MIKFIPYRLSLFTARVLAFGVFVAVGILALGIDHARSIWWPKPVVVGLAAVVGLGIAAFGVISDEFGVRRPPTIDRFNWWFLSFRRVVIWLIIGAALSVGVLWSLDVASQYLPGERAVMTVRVEGRMRRPGPRAICQERVFVRALAAQRAFYLCLAPRSGASLLEEEPVDGDLLEVTYRRTAFFDAVMDVRYASADDVADSGGRGPEP